MKTLVPPPITPGPWVVGTPSTYATYNANQINAKEVSICEVYGIPLHSSLEEVEGDPKYKTGVAHAKFIAAAPAMASALALAYDYLVNLPPGELSESREAYLAVENALKQAGYTEAAD